MAPMAGARIGCIILMGMETVKPIVMSNESQPDHLQPQNDILSKATGFVD